MTGDYRLDAAVAAFHDAVTAAGSWQVIDNDRDREEIEGSSRAVVAALLAAGWFPPPAVKP